jgi:hypothetical protein
LVPEMECGKRQTDAQAKYLGPQNRSEEYRRHAKPRAYQYGPYVVDRSASNFLVLLEQLTRKSSGLILIVITFF